MNIVYPPQKAIQLLIISSHIFSFGLLHRFYLPGFDSDTGHRVSQADILDCDVRDASFCRVLPQPTDADPMAWPAVHVVDMNIGASSLYGDAIIACFGIQMISDSNGLHISLSASPTVCDL